ncbi:MAG: class I SAM-dependent methyltransferase [Planctomycetota bacterium]
MAATQTVTANWYDLPKYYDLAFRSESRREGDFFEAAFRKYCPFRVRHLLEPACGSGRLVAEMAARGYRVTGFDLNEAAIEYLRQRLARRKLKAHVFCGDMSDFALPRPVDAAFNTFDSFRHLLTEEAAASHLRCVAESLRPGGIYILGLHLLPPDADLDCIERWKERHGRTSLSVTLSVASCDVKQRVERLRVSMLVRTPSRQFRLRDEFSLRTYSADQMRRLLRKAPQFEVCDVYDYWYEIDEPLKLDNKISDTIFILRKW